jgi:hypothetical protein
MKEAALLLNALVESGVVTDYALFGAVAQMGLPWEEKLRQAVALREALRGWAAPRPAALTGRALRPFPRGPA